MKHLLFAILSVAGLSAAVQTDTELVRENLTVRVERRYDTPDQFGNRPEILLVHIRTSTANRFRVTLRLKLRNGETVIRRQIVERTTGPGTGGTTLSLDVRPVDEIMSLTVEEIFVPRVTDFS